MNKLKAYYKYFLYVLEHKKNVFIECWKRKMFFHAITHDLSKFSVKEFIPYAKYFNIDKEKYNEKFLKAWKHHYEHNKHHWNYWVVSEENCIRMPNKHVDQMICDWYAMSRKFGGNPQQFYIDNYHKIRLHRDSRYYLELKLGFYNHYNHPIDYTCQEYFETLEETAIRYAKEYENSKQLFNELYTTMYNYFRLNNVYDEIIEIERNRIKQLKYELENVFIKKVYSEQEKSLLNLYGININDGFDKLLNDIYLYYMKYKNDEFSIIEFINLLYNFIGISNSNKLIKYINSCKNII